MEKKKRLKNARYITGFDGVRTLAVIGVILYHLVPSSLQGGYLGVPIFFVVSGYLITDLLNQEWQQNNKIDILGFYVRRVRRLYPALLAMLVTTIAYITLFQRDLLTNIKEIFASNLLYVYNWFQVLHKESYFDHFGTPSPFTHLWSLSIEGQYYLFWPIIVALLVVFLKQKQRIFNLIFILAFISALLMAFLYKTGSDPSRVYYGTDTRMFSILLGSALSFIWPSSALKKEISNKGRIVLDALGVSSLLAIILVFFTMSDQSSLVYRGGMFFFSVLVMIFVATVAHPGADMNKLMTNPLFTWIGKRSYGIYLYQFPIMVFYESKIQSIGSHPWRNALIEIAMILIVSDLSYRFLERPLQRFDYKQTFKAIKSAFMGGTKNSRQKITVIMGLLVIGVAAFGMVVVPQATATGSNDLQANISKNAKLAEKKNATALKKTSSSESKKTDSSKKTSSAKKESKAPAEKQSPTSLTKAEVQKASNVYATAIGDSVLADGADLLQDALPHMYVDAKVGRQVYNAADDIKALDAQGKLQDNVLVGLGTNSPFTTDQFDEVMDAIGSKRQVYWINVHVPTRRWEGPVNSMLESQKKKYSNLHIIDWHSYSKNNTDWFYDDNVHPDPDGSKYYATYIARELIKNM
ncbi:acyltransferase family protein [Dellaglioa carnosa]|uniref:acyltransferase family protein n=1 Tax=Dellaglioa carnosa TaxID=2995136 RepID=UPI0022A88B95|nr:acyltransferase family protein [Dellaglioa carnosa]MCZ2492460.1 acetyltransferase [Dellaglioa carnosa]